MIRGWRNDLLWVAYYDQKRKDKLVAEWYRRQVELAQAQAFEAACAQAVTDPAHVATVN